MTGALALGRPKTRITEKNDKGRFILLLISMPPLVGNELGPQSWYLYLLIQYLQDIGPIDFLQRAFIKVETVKGPMIL